MAHRVVIPRSEIDAVIFDMDGVITRTASVHQAAWKRMFDDFLRKRSKERGTRFEPFTPEDYRLYVDGKPRQDGVVSFFRSRGITLPLGEPDDSAEIETVHGLGNRKNEYFVRHLHEHGVDAYQSTIDLIRALRSAGVKTAVFSASKNAGEVLRAAGVFDLFDAKVDGTDAAQLGIPGKPDPATLLEAARRLSVSTDRAVIVEDAIAGVQAGRAGGFHLVIGVDRTHEPGALLSNGADVEVSDLSEVALGP